MNSIDKETQSITEVINLYFNGTYYGNPDQLNRAFHKNAHITGNLNGEIYDWTLVDFIERVTTPPTSSTKGEKYDKAIVFIDINNNAAMVKARVVVGGLVFIDYITLLKIKDQWIIRNKSFTS